MKFDVYFAAPFFCDGEISINNLLVSALEKHNLRVFYPFRDGFLAKDEIAGGIPDLDVMAKVWGNDTQAIRDSKVIVAVLDGRSVDEGVCVEVGYAAALEKPIVGFLSDDRKCFSWGLNPMLSFPLKSISADVQVFVRSVLDASSNS